MQSLPPLSAQGRARPVVVEILSRRDAQSDLTPARDLKAGLEKDFDVRLCELDRDEVADTPAGLVCEETPPDKVLRGEMRLASTLRTLRPEIVHTYRFADLLAIGRIARTDTFTAKVVHTLGSEPEARIMADERAIRTILGGLEPVLVAGGEVGPTCLEAVAIPQGIDSTHYCPGDPARARRKLGLPVDAQIIGCAGPASGIEPLLQAIFRLQPNVHIAVFGAAAPVSHHRPRIRRLNLEERVHILGPWADPVLIYQAIDAYFHGASSDACPRAVLAAQAAGKPVVALLPARPETLCPEVCHLLPPQFGPGITAALRNVLARGPGTTSRDFVARNWGIARMIDGYADLFFRLLGADTRLTAIS